MKLVTVIDTVGDELVIPLGSILGVCRRSVLSGKTSTVLLNGAVINVKREEADKIIEALENA